MKKQSGFTLIELLVVLTILAVFAALVIGGIAALVMNTSDKNDDSFGINGIVTTRCIGGYQHTVGAGGRQTQIIGENGGGVPCSK